MAENSKIEWLAGGSTWNFMDAVNIETGKAGFFCEKIAPECKLCYAEKMNVNTYFGNGIRYAVDQRGKVRITLNDRKLNKPLHWRKPRLVFPCSMTDLFGAWVPDEWIDAAYDVMEKAHWHTFLVLTKRPGRRMEYLRKRYANRPPAPNIWEGTSCGLQETADEFIPLLLQTPAAVRWISAEPLLGGLDIVRYMGHRMYRCSCGFHDTESELTFMGGDVYYCRECEEKCSIFPAINWLVAGGESGPNARPMHPDWARSLRDQCKAAGVPYFFKQWGEWAHGSDCHKEQLCVYADGRSCEFTQEAILAEERRSGIEHRLSGGTVMAKLGKKTAGRKLSGVEHNEYPVVAAGERRVIDGNSD